MYVKDAGMWKNLLVCTGVLMGISNYSSCPNNLKVKVKSFGDPFHNNTNIFNTFELYH